MGNHVCPWWLAYTFDNPVRRLFHDPEKICGPYLSAGMTALDVGCGMGYFSIGMAKIVGKDGKVISADIQQEMLDVMRQRAEKEGVHKRIAAVLSDADDIGVNEQADFVLAFWMVHETPEISSFLKQVHTLLKPAGKLLVAEPKLHVTAAEFKKTLETALELGFTLIDTPDIFFSHSAVFEKRMK